MGLERYEVKTSVKKLRARWSEDRGIIYQIDMLPSGVSGEIRAVLHELEYILCSVKLNKLDGWSLNDGCYSTMYFVAEDGQTSWLHLYWNDGRIDVEQGGRLVQSVFLGDPNCFEILRRCKDI